MSEPSFTTEFVPLYESEWATVYCADAAAVLPAFATESFDLVVTDPPYNVAFQSNMRAEKFAPIVNDGDNADDRATVLEILRQCVRLTAQNRHLYVFGPEVMRANDLKVSAPAEIIWDKLAPGMGDLSIPWGKQHETVNFYTCLHRHGGKRGSENQPVRLRRGTILRYGKPTGRTVRHPTEKPVPLLREFIESSSRPGDRVLDPCAGIGSTAVAAILSGRRVVVIEIDPTYAAMAVERIKNAEQIMTLGATA